MHWCQLVVSSTWLFSMFQYVGNGNGYMIGATKSEWGQTQKDISVIYKPGVKPRGGDTASKRSGKKQTNVTETWFLLTVNWQSGKSDRQFENISMFKAELVQVSHLHTFSFKSFHSVSSLASSIMGSGSCFTSVSLFLSFGLFLCLLWFLFSFFLKFCICFGSMWSFINLPEPTSRTLPLHSVTFRTKLDTDSVFVILPLPHLFNGSPERVEH